MNRTLEHYLKQATRGLHGTVKKEVWDELEGDILERVSVSRAFGLSEGEAVKRALEQLGSAQEVSSGMAETYIWPRAGKWLTSLVLGGGVLLSLQAIAQSGVTLESPRTPGYFYVSQSQLVKALEAQGFKIELSQNLFNVMHPQVGNFSLPITPYNTQKRGQDTFVVLNNILNAAVKAGFPVSLKGWETLEVSIGGKAFVLNPEKGQNNFALWYADSARAWTNFAALASSQLKTDVILKGKRPDLAGQVVVAVSNIAVQKPLGLGSSAYATQVSPDGSFTLRVPTQTLKSLSKTGQRDAREGLYLAVFSEKYNASVSQKFLPLKTQLKVGQTLEPGKTYAL